MGKSRPVRSEGFTLLEVVVALAIVGIAGVAALEAFGAEVRGADKTQQALPAAALAEERLGRFALPRHVPRAARPVPLGGDGQGGDRGARSVRSSRPGRLGPGYVRAAYPL